MGLCPRSAVLNPFLLSVTRHVHPFNGDFCFIMYYQNDTIHFKQTLFCSRTERPIKGGSVTPASTCQSMTFSAQQCCEDHVYFLPNTPLQISLLKLLNIIF
jgi:hypothetical protein